MITTNSKNGLGYELVGIEYNNLYFNEKNYQIEEIPKDELVYS